MQLLQLGHTWCQGHDLQAMNSTAVSHEIGLQAVPDIAALTCSQDNLVQLSTSV